MSEIITHLTFLLVSETFLLSFYGYCETPVSMYSNSYKHESEINNDFNWKSLKSNDRSMCQKYALNKTHCPTYVFWKTGYQCIQDRN